MGGLWAWRGMARHVALLQWWAVDRSSETGSRRELGKPCPDGLSSEARAVVHVHVRRWALLCVKLFCVPAYVYVGCGYVWCSCVGEYVTCSRGVLGTKENCRL